ncbi:MAG: hypothetical protein HY319_04425 [Armatimonadetes bacterium]|nr:hypothetical protein [Armatimonadota bacterium]
MRSLFFVFLLLPLWGCAPATPPLSEGYMGTLNTYEVGLQLEIEGAAVTGRYAIHTSGRSLKGGVEGTYEKGRLQLTLDMSKDPGPWKEITYDGRVVEEKLSQETKDKLASYLGPNVGQLKKGSALVGQFTTVNEKGDTNKVGEPLTDLVFQASPKSFDELMARTVTKSY